MRIVDANGFDIGPVSLENICDADFRTAYTDIVPEDFTIIFD